MITFKKITIQNFMSFGNNTTEVDLEQSGSTLIIGDNKDIGEEGYSKNGVGKSTIFKALCWCLFDETPENIKQNDYINKFNKKKMLVTCDFSIGNDDWQVIRGRKPNRIEIYRNGNPETPHSLAEANEKLKELLSMDLDIFSNTISLSASNIPYMQMKPANQRDFMEQFLNLDILSERANTLKSEKSDYQTDIKMEERGIEEQRKINERLETDIQTVQNKIDNWNKEHEQIIDSAKKEIDQVESEFNPDELDKEMESAKAIREKKNKLNELTRELQGVERSLQNEKLKEQEKESKKREIETLQAEIGKLKTNIEREWEQFSDEYKDINNDELEKLREEQNELQQELSKTQREVDGHANAAERADDELKRTEKEKQEREEELQQLLDSTCPYCGQEYHDQLKINALKESIDNLEDGCVSLSKTIDREVLQAEHKHNSIKVIEKQNKELVEQVSNYDNLLNKKKEAENGIQLQEQSFIDKEKTIERLNNEYQSLDVENDKELNEKAKQLESDIAKLESEINASPYSNDNAVDELYEIINEYKRCKEKYDQEKNKENPFIDELERIQNNIVEVDDSKLREWKKYVTHIDHLIKLLTDSKSFVRRNLINQYVPFINKQLNKYLDVLHLPHTVEINPDLSVDIYYLNETTSYGNLSGGERLRLNMATSFALRDINAVMGRSTNIMLIDEYLDNGLDQSGFKSVMRMIKNSNIENVMVISHREEIVEMVDHVITVVKENGYTRLESDQGMDNYRQI